VPNDKYEWRDDLVYQQAAPGDWQEKTAWRGLTVENVVQSIAYDIMVEKMLRLDAMGVELIGSVHDEIIARARADDAEATLTKMICDHVGNTACMGRRPTARRQGLCQQALCETVTGGPEEGARSVVGGCGAIDNAGLLVAVGFLAAGLARIQNVDLLGLAAAGEMDRDAENLPFARLPGGGRGSEAAQAGEAGAGLDASILLSGKLGDRPGGAGLLGCVVHPHKPRLDGAQLLDLAAQAERRLDQRLGRRCVRGCRRSEFLTLPAGVGILGEKGKPVLSRLDDVLPSMSADRDTLNAELPRDFVVGSTCGDQRINRLSIGAGANNARAWHNLSTSRTNGTLRRPISSCL
jgi:hypothetical protein